MKKHGVIQRYFHKYKKTFCSFLRGESGLAAVEMAITLPILVSLFLSGVEISRYILLHQKLERASATVADLVAREEMISESEINDIFHITEEVMRPFDIGANTTVILSSIAKADEGAATVIWQRSYGTSSTAPTGSRYGTTGDVADLPEGFLLRNGEGIITAEVAHDFKATFMPELLPDITIYKDAIYRPRFGSLLTVLDN